MGNKILKKQFEEEDVYEAALSRTRDIFDRFDTVVVSFSGGKDSTACFQLAYQVAGERNQWPLHVMFFDEEAIAPETVDYVRRVSQLPGIEMKWLCLPVKHRNGASSTHPYWYCWNPEKQDLWCRELPSEAIVNVDGFQPGMTVPEASDIIYSSMYGQVGMIVGLRAEESIRRYRVVATRETDNWIGRINGNTTLVYPVYDWMTDDVWLAPHLFGWDYNRAYDLMDMSGLHYKRQRVCPPYGEEPLRGLDLYHKCWPELWDKMICRVPGVATAARYAKTELYGWGDLVVPEGHDWKSWAMARLNLYPEDVKALVAKSVARVIREHKNKTDRPIELETPDPHTGISWKAIASLVIRGDMKGRRRQKLQGSADPIRKQLGLSLEEIQRLDRLGLDLNEYLEEKENAEMGLSSGDDGRY